MPPCIRWHDVYHLFPYLEPIDLWWSQTQHLFCHYFWQLAASKGPLSDSFWRRRQSSCFGCRRARVSNAGRSCFWSQVGLFEDDGAFPEVHTMLSLFQYRLLWTGENASWKYWRGVSIPVGHSVWKQGCKSCMLCTRHRRVLQSRKSMANLGWPALESLAASKWFAKNIYSLGIQMRTCMYEVM